MEIHLIKLVSRGNSKKSKQCKMISQKVIYHGSECDFEEKKIDQNFERNSLHFSDAPNTFS